MLQDILKNMGKETMVVLALCMLSMQKARVTVLIISGRKILRNKYQKDFFLRSLKVISSQRRGYWTRSDVRCWIKATSQEQCYNTSLVSSRGTYWLGSSRVFYILLAEHNLLAAPGSAVRGDPLALSWCPPILCPCDLFSLEVKGPSQLYPNIISKYMYIFLYMEISVS